MNNDKKIDDLYLALNILRNFIPWDSPINNLLRVSDILNTYNIDNTNIIWAIRILRDSETEEEEDDAQDYINRTIIELQKVLQNL